MRFDQHTVVLLVRPTDAPELAEDEANALQDAHLASQAALHDAGHIIAAGSLVGQDDERLRGIAVLSVEVMTWMVPAGNVRFENVPRPRSMREATEEG